VWYTSEPTNRLTASTERDHSQAVPQVRSDGPAVKLIDTESSHTSFQVNDAFATRLDHLPVALTVRPLNAILPAFWYISTSPNLGSGRGPEWKFRLNGAMMPFGRRSPWA